MGVHLRLYRCPVCEGQPSGCVHCHGAGATSDTAGWEPHELVELPRPPGVMRRPCVDCAFRAGSPEQEYDYELNGLRTLDRPFHCHHGMELIAGAYTPAATLDGAPVGYLVCAGWWAWATGAGLPRERFRQHPREARHEADHGQTKAPDESGADAS